jgi:hypothetical protein
MLRTSLDSHLLAGSCCLSNNIFTFCYPWFLDVFARRDHIKPLRYLRRSRLSYPDPCHLYL